MNRQFLISGCVILVFLFLIIEKAYSAEGNSINKNYPIDLNKIQGGTALLSRSFYFIENRGWEANDDSIALKTADSIIAGNFDDFFNKTKTDNINLGLVNSYYWFKINFENSGNYPLYRYIKVDSRELADIRVFVAVGGKVISFQKGGRFIPVSERPYFSINHIFPVEFPPNSQSTILIRVYSPIILWVTFHTSKSLQKAEYEDLIPLIIFFGIFIAVFLYNLFLAISLRDKTYVYYLGHAFFLGVFFFLTNGFVSLLTPSLINASPQLILTAPGISVIFYLLFTSSFLDAKNSMPYINKLLIYSIPLFAFASFSWLFFDLHFSVMYIIQPLSALFMIVAIGVSIYAVAKGYKSARMLLYGTLLYQIGALITGFVYTGRFLLNFFTFHALQIGFTCELIFLSFALGDKMKRLKLEKESAERREVTLQQKFSQLVLESQEHERRRIAGALHDSIGQDFLIIKNWIDIALSKLNKGQDIKQQLEEIKNISNNAVEEVRAIAKDLYPYQLEQIGLKNSLEMIVKTMSNVKDLGVSLQIDNVESFLSSDQKSHIFRIVQEAFNNILKHSKAKNVFLSMKIIKGNFLGRTTSEPDSSLMLTITDDGVGFDSSLFYENRIENVGMGLSGIRERARILNAKLQIESQKNKGTVISLNIPIPTKYNTKNL